MNENYLKQFKQAPDSAFVERIRARLEKKERFQAIKKHSVFSVLTLIFLFGLLMTFSSTVRAAVLQTLQEIAGLQFEITSKYPGTGDEITVPSEYLSLEEAQSRFPSPIMLPTYLPQGYEQPGEVVLSEDLFLLMIIWESKEQWAASISLDIWHCPSGVEKCGLTVGEGAVEEIVLNEKPAVLVRGGWNYDTKQYELYHGSLAMIGLMWKYDDQTVYMLRADEQTVPVQELIKMAESIP